MKKICIIVCLINIYACSLFESSGYDLPDEKVYVALQAFDQVGIVDVKSGSINYIDIDYSLLACSDYSLEDECNLDENCEWMSMGGMSHCMDVADECMELNEAECNSATTCEWMSMGGMSHCMENGGMMDMGNHTPHFIELDELNGFWFVSTISSGYIGQYGLETNELLDNIWVGDSPALLASSKQNKKLYVSRMMPMLGMMTGSTSSIVQEIDYSNQNLLSSNEFEITSPAPHGLSINDDGDYVYTISNTADWVYKISTSSGLIEGASLDPSVGNPSNLATQRLKPIQCVTINDELLLITCSAGTWYDPNAGNEQIPGQIQLWNTNSMTLLDTIQFSSYSTPWHIVSDVNTNRFYVALAGDPGKPGYSGVACIGHENNAMELIWENVSEEFSMLHGIDMSSDGSVIYVSGRGDDYLHVFDSNDGEKIKSIYLGMHAMSAGIKAMEK